jgi:hydrogenase-1 operon protein HyaE
MTEMQNTLDLHPLVSRLLKEFNYSLISDQSSLDKFIGSSGNKVLFCGGDPVQYPECLDVAVVLPELERAFPGFTNFSVCTREMDIQLKSRYGFNVWPTLLFLRDGGYVGIISGIKDWTVYLERISELLKTEVSRPPSVGISISATSGQSCH